MFIYTIQDIVGIFLTVILGMFFIYLGIGTWWQNRKRNKERD